MADLVTIATRMEAGRVVPDAGLNRLYDQVMGGDIVVLKKVFPADLLHALRNDVADWGVRTPAQNIDRLSAKESWHRRDIEPPMSATKRIFETYLLAGHNPDDEISERVKPVAKVMGEFWNRLTKSNADFTPDDQGRALRPQIIHYPSGGGYFDWHIHDLVPQQIGLILCLSERGKNFKTGGTRFETDGKVIEPADEHDIGDMVLFRFDLSHDIAPIDEGEPLNWSGSRGRWTLVLPLI